MLSELHLRDVGPAPKLDVEFAERLNIFTGDNGLGKTFLLDCAWYAQTGSWPSFPALPREGAHLPQISVVCKGRGKPTPGVGVGTLVYDLGSRSWPSGSAASGWTAIYARADGGVSVYDRLRTEIRPSLDAPSSRRDNGCVDFDSKAIWYGIHEGEQVICNGMLRDLVEWQLERELPGELAFDTLSRVVARLSEPNEPIEIGRPVRPYANDARRYPTIKTPYGIVPIHLAPSGLKRILGLAYVMVWAWKEHRELSSLGNHEPYEHIDLLIDEPELHLHPRWQRSILPSLLAVRSDLGRESAQLLVTTHSPLVLASIEPEFDEERDRLFLFDVEKGSVELNEVPWAKQGDANNWLTSDIFGLGQARSIEAERAIQAAQDFMLGLKDKLPPGLKTKKSIHKELLRVLPDHDRFWPRWIVTAYETAGKGS